MVAMLVSLIVLLIILGAVYTLLGKLPIGSPFKEAILIVFIVVAIILLLGYLPGVPWHYHWSNP